MTNGANEQVLPPYLRRLACCRPPDLWEKWLEREYQDKAPKLVKDAEGGGRLGVHKGPAPISLGLVACVGVPADRIRWHGWRYSNEVHPTCYEGRARLDALDG